jgi:ubiquinone/menaquinone biosynthesis C-methylase UbiE
MHGPSNPETLARAEKLWRLPAGALLPPARDGIVDLLGAAFRPTFTQRTLDTAATAWLYDRVRDALAPALGMPDFASETQALVERLALSPGGGVLDVACGPGHISVGIARRVGARGLVIGLDIAGAMLARAVQRVRRAGLDNVLLVRADALALPFVDGAFAVLNCSGGLHQLPDLDRAFAEFARVTRTGARFAASGFGAPGGSETGWRDVAGRRLALHFVPVDRVAAQLAAARFDEIDVRMAGRFIAYASARRGA